MSTILPIHKRNIQSCSADKHGADKHGRSSRENVFVQKKENTTKRSHRVHEYKTFSCL